MIEINLLPEESKPKTKKITRYLKPDQFLNYIVWVFVILIVVHFFLAGILVAKSLHLNVLNNKWQKLLPQRKLVGDFNKEREGLSKEDKIITQLANQRINWSEKLNKLSLNLPSGIWFNEISVTPKELILKASVVSLQKEEMSLINKFMDNLKKDSFFFKDFNNLELNSVQRKVIGGYEVADFILIATLKSK